jgi:hypothetical protein
LPTDLIQVPSKNLDPIHDLTATCEPKLTILHVNVHLGKEIPSTDSLSMGNVNTTYQEIPLTKTIIESVNLFVE